MISVIDRRRNFLDSEFRKVARLIDKGFRRASFVPVLAVSDSLQVDPSTFSVYGSSVAPSLPTASIMSFKENEEVEASPTLLEVKPPSRPPSILVPPPGVLPMPCPYFCCVKTISTALNIDGRATSPASPAYVVLEDLQMAINAKVIISQGLPRTAWCPFRTWAMSEMCL